MNFIMIGLLLREALDRLCVRLNMYLFITVAAGNAGKADKATTGGVNLAVYLAVSSIVAAAVLTFVVILCIRSNRARRFTLCEYAMYCIVYCSVIRRGIFFGGEGKLKCYLLCSG